MLILRNDNSLFNVKRAPISILEVVIARLSVYFSTMRTGMKRESKNVATDLDNEQGPGESTPCPEDPEDKSTDDFHINKSNECIRSAPRPTFGHDASHILVHRPFAVSPATDEIRYLSKGGEGGNDTPRRHLSLELAEKPLLTRNQ